VLNYIGENMGQNKGIYGKIFVEDDEIRSIDNELLKN